MNMHQKTYAAFLESVCNKFNCPEMAPALKEGFQALCESMSDTRQTELPFAERVNTFEEIINTLGTSLVDKTWISKLIEQMRTINQVNKYIILSGPKMLHLPVEQWNRNYEQGNFDRAEERVINFLHQAGIPAKKVGTGKSPAIAVAIDEDALSIAQHFWSTRFSLRFSHHGHM